MPFEKTFIPIAKGTDESVDSRLRPPDRVTVTNGYWKKRNKIQKRNGFSAVTQTKSDGTSVDAARGIFSTGPEMCLLGKRQLLALNEQHSRWYDRGQIAPCMLRSKRVFREEQPYFACDLGIGNGYVMYAGVRYSKIDESGTDVDTALCMFVDTLEGSGTQLAAFLGVENSVTNNTRPFAPRILVLGTKFHLFYGVDTVTPGTLRRRTWDSASPETAIGSGTDVTTDLWVHASSSYANVRTFDAIPLANGNYALAWIDDTAQEIEVRIFNASHVQQATATLTDTAPYSRVALCEDSASGKIFVLAAATGESNVVELWGLANSNLATSWGPTTLDSHSTEVAENLGVVAGGTSTRVVGVWTWRADSSTVGHKSRVSNKSLDTNGANGDTLRSAYNLYSRTRPFYQDGRCYVGCVSTVASHIHATNDIHDVGGTEIQTDAFECACLLDLYVDEDNPDTTGRQPSLAGVWDTGAAMLSWFTGAAHAGNGANVHEETLASGKWRWTSISTVFSLWQSGDALAAKFGIDEVKADFNESPMVAIVHRGAAAIGGAFVAWYDGGRVVELGHPVPPVCYSIETGNISGGTLAEGTTYTWIPVWQEFDKKGNVIRSIPGPPCTKEIPSGEIPAHNSAVLTAKGSHVTNKLHRRHMSCVWYRDDGTGIFKRVSEPQRYIQNTADSTYVTPEFRDHGQPLGELLYITGGEIEAVCPEGARIPTVALGRLFLGDMVRGDRCQFSDPIAAGSAFEDPVQPEFNEGFGFLLDSGMRVMGQCDLDELFVLFTETEIYCLAGRGPDNAGAGNDFSGLQLISNDTGCIDARSVVGTPDGIMFQGKAGLYLLDRARGLHFIGEAVRDKLASYPTITSAVLVPKQNQVRFTCVRGDSTDAIVLVYDYRIQQWVTWTIKRSGGSAYVPIGACMHKDVYHLVDSSGRVRKENSAVYLDDTTEYVSQVTELTFEQSPGLWQRVRRIVPFLERSANHDLKVELLHDWESVADKSRTWTASEIALMVDPTNKFQPEMDVRRQQCQAVTIRLSDTGGLLVTNSSGYTISGMIFEWMPKRGIAKFPKSART